MPKTITLKSPITTHEGESREIVLRDPVGSDYVKLKKVPLTFRQDKEGTTSMDVDYEIAVRWLSALSGIDDILIGKLQRADFIAAVGALNDHLMAEGDTPGNSPS